MSMSISGRCADVEITAYTELKCEFLREVGKFTARIKTATIYWSYKDGVWDVDFVRIEGPVIRKSDGAESTRHVSESTHMPGHPRSRYGKVTPPEIVEFALANPPEWVPNFREVPLTDASNGIDTEERTPGFFGRALDRWSRRRGSGAE
ncbi:MAG: hypothetical protein GX875_10450 [Propionibacterium sp.]|nr:hypothetical protein [Propionibacterium sp.]